MQRGVRGDGDMNLSQTYQKQSRRNGPGSVLGLRPRHRLWCWGAFTYLLGPRVKWQSYAVRSDLFGGIRTTDGIGDSGPEIILR